MASDCKMHVCSVLAINLSSLHVTQSLFLQLQLYAFAIFCTASNDQLCVEPRLYHYRWSWVLPGLFWLSDATNDVQFYWAVRLQWRRVCWSGRCCGVSTHPAWLVLLSKYYCVTLKGIGHWGHCKAGGGLFSYLITSGIYIYA